ncbi:MAG: contractile injection system protein, VgrG/Pvc8 family [Caulobacteraceae bacterium]|nr:contractile injection system protein, VgrG/Pvc8 family [Caulobacteraceae bacterium]
MTDAPDDLTLKVGGNSISGWSSVRVTCGIERCPNDFDIEMTDLYPGQATDVVVQPGDKVQVLLGGDLVLDGYVDKVIPSYDAEQHAIRLAGRGKCQDLVDCSAEWPTGQISGTSALDIATKLAQPYGVTVAAPDGSGPAIPQFNLMLGETAYEIIERVCRYSGLLCYEALDGTLTLAQAGDKTASSGLVEGQNILAAHFEWSLDQRYSEYDVFLLAMDPLSESGKYQLPIATASDGGVTRHRKLYVIADAGQGGMTIAQNRANWEANRRNGRGAALHITVDSWRDSGGTLWTPNSRVPVSVPSLKYQRTNTPVVSEVTFLRDARGTRAEMVLMPPEAFTLEPLLLQPIIPDAKPTTPATP